MFFWLISRKKTVVLLLTNLIVFWQIEICIIKCLTEVRLYNTWDKWLFVKSIINKLWLRKLAFYAYSFYFINNLKGTEQDREKTRYTRVLQRSKRTGFLRILLCFPIFSEISFLSSPISLLPFFILHMLISVLSKFLLLYISFFFVVKNKEYMKSGWKIN